jgi:hypothetical protein
LIVPPSVKFSCHSNILLIVTFIYF